MAKLGVVSSAFCCRIIATAILALGIATPAFPEDKPNRIERTAKKAADGTERTAKRAGKFVEKTATRAGKFVERTANKTGNAIKRAVE